MGRGCAGNAAPMRWITTRNRASAAWETLRGSATMRARELSRLQSESGSHP